MSSLGNSRHEAYGSLVLEFLLTFLHLFSIPSCFLFSPFFSAFHSHFFSFFFLFLSPVASSFNLIFLNFIVFLCFSKRFSQSRFFYSLSLVGSLSAMFTSLRVLCCKRKSCFSLHVLFFSAADTGRLSLTTSS